ncbi:hypothetical protein HHK36_027378 [Tetracentron sinense]|uniref:Uncharacterized protein n=1 Tax=Tetracentron sinense TaxID=13715 RepID=A0A834YCX9_TETSI|nr:hypothetical protein HHK36_027378 [Tetracentron sinense]
MMSIFSSFDAVCAEFFGQTVVSSPPWDNKIQTQQKKTPKAIEEMNKKKESPPAHDRKPHQQRAPRLSDTFKMSIFSFSDSAICADYFGDELGLPLPSLNTANSNKTKADPTGDSLTAEEKKTLGNSSTPGQVRKLQQSAVIDGLHFSETLIYN